MKKLTIYDNEYWLKKGFTLDESIKKVEHTKKETSWRCIEFWKKRGYNDEESKILISKKQSEISLKRDKTKKIITPYSEEYYKNITDKNEILKLIQDRKEKSNPYKKWSKDELEKIIQKRKNTYYSKTKEELENINKKRGRTKKELIEKFGDYSKEIFFNRGKGARKSYEKKYSKISIDLFETLLKLNPEKTFYYGKNEKYILNKNYKKNKKKGYYIDFLCEENKKIVEFNGDFWHMNPEKYLPESFITFSNGKKIIANNVWKQDDLKIKTLESEGYEIFIVWENEYKKNKEKIINDCNIFLNQKK